MDAPNVSDAAFDNRAAFPDCEKHYQTWRDGSARYAETVEMQPDIRYGDRPRNRLDFIQGRPDMPTLFHIHGGYWQWNDKEDYRCCAKAAHDGGLNAVIVEHTLAPEASMSEIAGEIKSALGWLRENRNALGLENSGIIVSGHSSGGHLAALCHGEDDVLGIVPISGLFDLRPITQIYVNDVLGMDQAEAEEYSPALHPKRYEGFAILAYGANELPSFCEQSRRYFEILRDHGNDVELLPVKGEDHFSVLNHLMEPTGTIFQAMMQRIG